MHAVAGVLVVLLFVCVCVYTCTYVYGSMYSDGLRVQL